MNEIQRALSKWIQLSYKSINDKVMFEADLFGFKKEMFDSKEVELIHNFTEGKVEGCFQVSYGVKKGNHTTAILTVEFGVNGFTWLAQRKTHIIKSVRNGNHLRSV